MIVMTLAMNTAFTDAFSASVRCRLAVIFSIFPLSLISEIVIPVMPAPATIWAKNAFETVANKKGNVMDVFIGNQSPQPTRMSLKTTVFAPDPVAVVIAITPLLMWPIPVGAFVPEPRGAPFQYIAHVPLPEE